MCNFIGIAVSQFGRNLRVELRILFQDGGGSRTRVSMSLVFDWSMIVMQALAPAALQTVSQKYEQIKGSHETDTQN
jgi:hypothetical protein